MGWIATCDANLWTPVWVQVAPLFIQLSANAPRRAAETGSSTGTLVVHLGDLDGILGS